MAQITTTQIPSDPNGNHDSGYAPSSIGDVLAANASPPGSPNVAATVIVNKNATLNSRNGSPRKEARLVAAVQCGPSTTFQVYLSFSNSLSPQCNAETAVVSAVRSAAGLIAQSKRLHAINELQLEGKYPER